MGCAVSPSHNNRRPRINKIISNKEELPKIKDCILKIKSNNNEFDYGTCFIYNIPESNFTVLITNSKFINEKINLIIYLNGIEHEIKIDKSNKKLITPKFNIAIIEINKEEKEILKKYSFLEIGETISKGNLVLCFMIDNEKIQTYCGKINKQIDKYFFEYSCETKIDSIGGVIFNNNNLKVIGIQINSKSEVCEGVFIKPMIEEFLLDYKNNKKKEILFENDIVTKSNTNTNNNNSLINLRNFDNNQKNEYISSKNKNKNENNTAKTYSKREYYKEDKRKEGNNKEDNKEKGDNKEVNIKEDNKEKENKINLIFKLNEKKNLYLDINKNKKFKEMIEILKNKYLWLKYFKNINFIFKENVISKNKTIEEIGLENNSIISITL